MIASILVFLLLASTPQQPEGPIVVSAAISLTDALQEIERAYRVGGGGPVRFNFAASNVLARQIANGAPADMFISADEVQMNYAEAAGAIDASSRRSLLTNRLAIVTPRGRTAGISDAHGLAGDSIRRIAVGDPAAVPAGAYAKRYLQQLELWDRLQARLVPLASVRAALSAAEAGAVDAAIVYESDAAASARVQLVYVVPRNAGPNIVYPAAISTRSNNRAAALRFLAFLQGPQARTIFERFHFGVFVPKP
ncbi:MAG: molybdate ABC transporter substrate-binding protein [Vicinamibacterales bacterium]